MPAYLDNIWGDENVVKGFGNALNQNFAELANLRFRQHQAEQANALNAAYYALERQKQAMQEPLVRAQTENMGAESGYHRMLAAGKGLENQAMLEQQARMKQLQDAVMQRYMAANPAMQQVQPPMLPTPTMAQSPMTPTMNMMNATMPQQVPSTMGPGAPTMANLGQLNAATIQSILAAQAAQTAAGARGVLEGNILRPGDVRQDLTTGQREEQVPGFVSPYQMMQYGLAQQREQTAEERAQETARHNLEMEKPKLSPAERMLEQARKNREAKASGGTGGGTAMPKVGEVRKGYRYKGGDPSQQSSWEVAQ